jgi:hypothetical protein
MYKPEWHTLKLRLQHLIHDSRFWMAVIVILFGLMLLLSLTLHPGQQTWKTPPYPSYPWLP